MEHEYLSIMAEVKKSPTDENSKLQNVYDEEVDDYEEVKHYDTLCKILDCQLFHFNCIYAFIARTIYKDSLKLTYFVH